MAQKSTVTCTVDVPMKVLGGKWKPIILWHVSRGPIRFNQLHRAVTGISQKILTTQLRELEHDGLIIRTVYPEVPPRVEYSISTFGTTLKPVLKALSDWGRTHASSTEKL